MSVEKPEKRETFFAPAGRATPAELQHAQADMLADPLVLAVIEGIPDPVLVLNVHRQIVTCNQAFLDVTGADSAGLFLGQRPGEAAGCIHCDEGPDGCGTGEHCVDCGAVNAVQECLNTRQAIARECRLRLQGTARSGVMDLLVRVNLVTISQHDVVVMALRDISAEKRRQVLERVFFHDVLNTASSIRALAWLMEDERQTSRQRAEYGRDLLWLTDQITDEIVAQRQLLAAEQDELQPEIEETQLAGIVQQVLAAYRNHEVARGRSLALGKVADGTIRTDPGLLRRVLGNLVKNALEATPEHGTATLGVELERDWAVFQVANPGVIPEPVQRQIFQRSFTTKEGEGRGIGAYSVRLLVERYLGGTVSFVSNEEAGTVFTVALPRQGPTHLLH
jgi:hypothetical protein